MWSRQERFKKAKELKKYCHADGCEDWEFCPKQCFCRHKRHKPLELDTAIAWRVGKILGEYREDCSNQCRSAKEIIRQLIWIVGPHSGKYQHLLSLLNSIPIHEDWKTTWQ